MVVWKVVQRLEITKNTIPCSKFDSVVILNAKISLYFCVPRLHTQNFCINKFSTITTVHKFTRMVTCLQKLMFYLFLLDLVSKLKERGGFPPVPV